MAAGVKTRVNRIIGVNQLVSAPEQKEMLGDGIRGKRRETCAQPPRTPRFRVCALVHAYYHPARRNLMAAAFFYPLPKLGVNKVLRKALLDKVNHVPLY